MSNLSIGTWMSLPNESIAEIYAKTGYEWIVIDLEHSAISINQAEKLIRIIDLAGSKPLVRLSGHSSSQIKRVLDAGACGIIAPMVNNVEEGKKILQACFYPPDGSRGMGLARAQGYGIPRLRDNYLKSENKDIEIYFQIESLEAVENIDKIFELPIEGYFIGPYDLSASLGDPGNFKSDKFLEAEAKVLHAAQAYSLQKGFHLVEPIITELKNIEERGYNKIAFSVDIRMIHSIAELPFLKS
jgi:2-dehydro-3-deoxyglucarate aldolase